MSVNTHEKHDVRKTEYNEHVISRHSSASSSVDVNSAGQQSYMIPIDKCIEIFGTHKVHGLSHEKAKQLLAIYGPNSIGDGEKVSILNIIMKQIFNAMILVLIISLIISFAIKDWITGGVITFIVALNVFIGTQQEYQAEKTMGSLKNLSSPSAVVIRNGTEQTIPSQEVVPGDLILVKVGDTIPADLRLIETHNFETDEALLTGESLPVAKDANELYGQEIPVGDRLNLAYSSSTVSKGRAVGIAVLTGLNTEIGKIAKALHGDNSIIERVQDKENAHAKDYAKAAKGTPLKIKLSWLAIYLFCIAVVFAIVVMASQKFDVTKEVAIYAICVALSMIPSSLVVVLTITMAVGAKEMLKRNVIVRKFDALENLGSVNAICSDKTGTLTQGRMIAKKVYIPGLGTFSVEDFNEPFNPTLGSVRFTESSPTELNDKNGEHEVKWITFEEFKEKFRNTEKYELFRNWILSASLANVAKVYEDFDDEEKVTEWKARGDPTEISIQVFVTRLNYGRELLVEESKAFTHLAEFPFDSSIKRMSSIYRNNENDVEIIHTKGAVERILKLCETWTDPTTGAVSSMSVESIDYVEEQMNSLSSQGLRVLAFATRTPKEQGLGAEWQKHERESIEQKLHFLGLIGIYDPPRPESLPSVKLCHHAGISVHMATGDHPSTASAIAREVGILPENVSMLPQGVLDSMVMTAPQFDALTEEQIDELPCLPLVIARCAPQTKVRLVEALHRRGQIVAMTGDGVNDSPSLKMSDIGIAMGKNGSDVAKDASDIVLADDNFASILNAVEEGRRMSDNIQKFVIQLLACNVAQALFLLIGLVFKDDDDFSVFPLSPVQVLWVIVVTACFPAMGLGMERAADDIMDRPPKDSKDAVFTWEVLIDMFVYGFSMASACMIPFVIEVYGYGDGELGENCNRTDYAETCLHVFRARASSFVTMTWCCLILAWEVIHLRNSLFLMRPNAENKWTQWMKDLWANKVLFWSVILGFVTLIPTIYIPVINDYVFLQKGISTGWAYAFGCSVFFLLVCEMWKFCKRVYFRNEKAKNPEEDLEKSGEMKAFEQFTES
ncbi:potassium/sodium efflux P-type ATPase, fungal-type [Pichia kudriavzevii]|uniref:P-type Na(+) transporter n=1 Tax=Pichia kudriavzevii TaxID=4909 RepID=A0A1Z8JHJ2_PICKU|nr:potassium/sodium efflux P-type ATPase, fungal-type [Pichia kudriavzevii]